MSRRTGDRNELIERLSMAGRAMGAANIFFHQAIAERLGLTGSDHKYLDLLCQEGPMTAGQLAELTGLTTGAITGVIDRLEQAGFVSRGKDPGDRRKVIVVPHIEKAQEQVGPIFASLAGHLHDLNASYTREELLVILDYLERTTRFFREQARAMRKDLQ